MRLEVEESVLGLQRWVGSRGEVVRMGDWRRSMLRVVTGAAFGAALSACGVSASGAATTVAPAPQTTSPATSPLTSTTLATSTTVALSGQSLPVEVQSDAAMHAAGNGGPSSVLVPSACVLAGGTVTARGTYQGGFAANVYPRYGDVIVLYVFTAPTAGFTDGVQVAELSQATGPSIGGSGQWQVTVPVDLSLGSPVRCLLAAQPTHDFEGAPSAY